MTRSSIETAKVTPAALIACRSIGASSHGLPASRLVARRVGEDVVERGRSARPWRRAASPAGSGASQRSRMVGAVAEMSTSSTPRTATTDGPPRSGRHTRPTRIARPASSGRANGALTSSSMELLPRLVVASCTQAHGKITRRATCLRLRPPTLLQLSRRG